MTSQMCELVCAEHALKLVTGLTNFYVSYVNEFYMQAVRLLGESKEDEFVRQNMKNPIFRSRAKSTYPRIPSVASYASTLKAKSISMLNNYSYVNSSA